MEVAVDKNEWEIFDFPVRWIACFLKDLGEIHLKYRSSEKFKPSWEWRISSIFLIYFGSFAISWIGRVWDIH